MLKKLLREFEENRSISSARDLINYFKTERSIEEIVLLTNMLAYSGAKLPKGENVVDIPSTGGPSSLSTVLCPLYLASAGLSVRKLGVSGRPAGGIDVLYQIPGYRTVFGIEEIKSIVADGISYFHFESAGTFAPLDALFFKYRRELSAVNSPQLAIASLLAKKIAMGLSNINLDVRASKFGNFGHSFEESVENAKRFCEVASCCDIIAKCTVSNAEIPYQPFIGRRESLLAIYNLLYGNANKWLQNHNDFCIRLCNELIQTTSCKQWSNFSLQDARHIFESNLLFQGTSIEAFMDIIASECREVVVEAAGEGWISYNLEAIRDALVDAQNRILHTGCSSDYPDPVGVELLVESGRYVKKGEPVLKIHYRTDININLYTADWFRLNEKKTETYDTRKCEVI